MRGNSAWQDVAEHAGRALRRSAYRVGGPLVLAVDEGVNEAVASALPK